MWQRGKASWLHRTACVQHMCAARANALQVGVSLAKHFLRLLALFNCQGLTPCTQGV